MCNANMSLKDTLPLSLSDNSLMKLCCLRNENIIKIIKENELSIETKYEP